jgi:hypothetical protein
MDYNNSISINGKTAYVQESNGAAENFNFHDYSICNYSPYLVIENGWDDKFFSLIKNNNIRSISLSNCVDMSFIKEYFSDLKQLIIDTSFIDDFSIITSLKELEDLSFISSKNFNMEIILPPNLKSLTIEWKSKFKLVQNAPISLEYISVYNGNNFDWSNFVTSKNLRKIDLNNCNNLKDDFISVFSKINYLSVYNCKKIEFVEDSAKNESLKYLYFNKVILEDINWISKTPNLDILILESCGTIQSIHPLSILQQIRGISVSGNTTITDGNLNILKNLKHLKNCFIAHKKHYSVKSIQPWNWNNFHSEKKELFD